MRSSTAKLIIGALVVFYLASMVYFFWGINSIEPEPEPVGDEIVEEHFSLCVSDDDDEQSECAVNYAAITAIDNTDPLECDVLEDDSHITECKDQYYIYQVKLAVDWDKDIEQARSNCMYVSDKNKDECLDPNKYLKGEQT